MSSIIQFLETMGGKPPVSLAEYAATVAALDAGVLQKQALLDRDRGALNGLLAGRASMCCMIVAAEEIRGD